MTDRLGRLLLVTLEAARVDAELPVLAARRLWLNSRRGIGGVAEVVVVVGSPGWARTSDFLINRRGPAHRRPSVFLHGPT